MRLLWQVAGATKLPVIGVGGCSSLEDVLAFLLVGASAVEGGTMNFVDPGITSRLTEELEAYLTSRGETLADVVGALADPLP